MISVLYIDDEPALLDISRLFLARSGDLVVDVTTSAVSALEMIKTKPFDAIVSDYQMPEMDGIVLLKEIRSRNTELPFILFTGKGREEVAIEAFDNGADFYKRITPDPQNANSPPEPPEEVVTPTITPTVSPTETPTVTPTITPTTTVTPTVTVTPTITQTPPPTETQTPTPTVTPTISPTVTPTTTPASQPIETPTLTPTPTISIPEPTPYDIVFGNYLKCQINYRKIENRFFTIFIPHIRCFREKISLENNLLYN